MPIGKFLCPWQQVTNYFEGKDYAWQNKSGHKIDRKYTQNVHVKYHILFDVRS